MNFLRLIRYKNILIIIATMLVVRYGLILSMLLKHYQVLNVTLELQFSTFGFIMLVLSTVFLSASGYIINDYFDVNADMLNKPTKVIIGKHISRRIAMVYHWVFNILGVAMGAVASYSIGFPNFSMVFVFIAGLLWFYSTSFSKEPFLGNLIIALLVALVPLIAGIYELLPLNFMYKSILNELYLSFEELLFWVLGYSSFAFLITLVREMVKDIEDLEGDAAYGRNTLPIAFGIKTAKLLTVSVFIVSIIALVIMQLAFLHSTYSVTLLYSTIVLPLIVALIIFIKSDSVTAYHKVSGILKIVMISGLLYIVAKTFLL